METTGCGDVYAFYIRRRVAWKSSAAGRGRRHPVDEEAAPGDHAVAGRKALQHFHHGAVGQPDLDLPQLDRAIMVARDPHPGALTFMDDGVARDRDRHVAFAGEDLHARE